MGVSAAPGQTDSCQEELRLLSLQNRVRETEEGHEDEDEEEVENWEKRGDTSLEI